MSPQMSHRVIAGLLASVSMVALSFAPAVRAATPIKTVSQDTIVVTAAHSTRKIESITRATMAQVAPGTSPIQVIAQLPGVNY
jgi:iron complex outermembrane receptor protein